MIELQQLTKGYGDLCAPPSRKLAVDGISATIRPGVVTGFLGPNGAGKSTTMRMILGLDRPTSGAALVNGRPYVDSPAPLAEVGALLDDFVARIGELETANANHPHHDDVLGHAKYVQDTVVPAMGAVREVADQLERTVPDSLWPLPKYSEILFIK